MKGRHSSFQRFGRIFGMPGSVVNKYPRSQDPDTGKKHIYDETKEYKHFDYYSTLSEEEKKKGKYDAHDNYGVLTKGISKWLEEDPRKDEKDIDQFFPENASVPSWQDPRGKMIDDYTPIAQENIPIVAEGNHEETYDKDGLGNQVIQLEGNVGFHETHANRPLIKETEDIAFRDQETICLPLKIPAETLHSILSCTKEIIITSGVSIGLKCTSAKVEGNGKHEGTIIYECVIPECPIECDKHTESLTFTCCTQPETTVASLNISTNRSKATLKRFKEYSRLTNYPIELDLSKNFFQEEKRYVLLKTSTCEQASPYEEPELPSSIKILKTANPKEYFDACCLTTPFSHGKYINYKFSEGDILSENIEVPGCVPQTARSGIIRLSEELSIAGFVGSPTLSEWGETRSPYAGGPSIAFSLHEIRHDYGNDLRFFFQDPRLELFSPEEQNNSIDPSKWYPLYVSSSCIDENGKTVSRKKLNPDIFRTADYKKRFLATTAGGSCLGHFFNISFCSESKNDPCSNGEFDVCQGAYKNRTCECEADAECEELAYQKNYGTAHQSSHLPTDDIVCLSSKSCCADKTKLPDEQAKTFVSALGFAAHLGRFVRYEPDVTQENKIVSYGRSLPIPIADTIKDNKEEVNASLFYNLFVSSEALPGGSISFYFTKAAASAAQGQSNSIGKWDTRECGTLKITHNQWTYETKIWAPVFEQYGSSVKHNLTTLSYQPPETCTGLTACELSSAEYAKPCDCDPSKKCEDGDPSEGCGCEIFTTYEAYKTIPFPTEVMCSNNWRGGKDKFCTDGCGGCYAYSPTDCTKYPCCGTGDHPCRNCDLTECNPPQASEFTLECPNVQDFGGLKTEYNDLNINISIEFRNFEIKEG